jgi:hypothetical protein
MAAGRLFSLHVTARLRDFFEERTHWQRRLWNVGLVLSIQEVLEAAEEQGKALHPAAVRDLADSVRSKMALDPGAGTELARKALARYLGGDLAVGGAAYEGINVALADIERNYLQRWAAVLATTDSPPNRERTARALASHLLDAGRTPGHLARWLRGLSATEGELPASTLFERAEDLLAEKPTSHEVFVPFEIEPQLKAQRPAEWIGSADASRWLRAAGHRGIRQRGGLLLSFETHGHEEAVNRAADVTDRFLARVSVGERTFGRFAPDAYLGGGRRASLIRGRRVEVRALTRENKVAAKLQGGDEVDAALELLSHLQSGPPAVAAAAGWSAIESLLLGPGDEDERNLVAAERLASLVTCSWPRAELTDLAWARVAAEKDALGQELAGLATNRERARRMAQELERYGRLREVKAGSDVAACHRLRPLFSDPRTLLLDIRSHTAESLRRLYRQRNLVMHAGRTRAVALEAALRTSSPLVGAGIDRLVHGALVKNLRPLELFAKADFEIARSGSDGAPHIVDLLE